jgi:hypothetical protein
MNRLILLFFSFVTAVAANAQLFPSTDYPSNYFRNPMGIALQLSANFGEVRTNHFHMGFDIRTNQKENLPVYASADGYISRVKIERYGFGRVIYINHPNGYTTLYAHLNNFYSSLHTFVKDKQYKEEQWEQDITFSPDQFPVTKGQFIAYSGNTGGSAGPHLHYEIRDTKTENNLNPWLFNFNLPDNIAPYIYRLYFYDRRYSTYQVGPQQIPIKRLPGEYTSTDSIVVLPTSTFSLGISSEDKTSTSNFLFGIYQAELYIDDSVRFAFRLNDFAYPESRLVNAAIDFKTKQQGGPIIQHLSRLPGNHSSIFSSAAADGVVIIGDTITHTAEIRAMDAAGNVTKLRFRFKFDPAKTKDYMFTQNSIPLLPNQENTIEFDDINVFFPATSFYHMVPFVYAVQETNTARAASRIHSLHNYTIPINDSFTVKIKTTLPANNPLRDRVVIQLTSNRKIEAQKGAWNGDWMTAKFGDLGNIRLLIDTVPPTIRPVGWKAGSNLKKLRSISFIVKDDVGEIQSFRAELDGKWLMFRRKDNSFIHDFDERTTPGAHELKVTVLDMAGNTSEKSYRFIR